MILINVGGSISISNVNQKPPKKNPKSKLWIGLISGLIVLIIKLLLILA
jgi:hypothetical protein